MANPLNLSPELEKVKSAALRAIGNIRPADSQTKAPSNFLFTAQRTKAGRKLPPYYLVYFLFVDLLGFKNLGQFEKIAWSVPIDFNGEAFLIEHRKMGLGVFAQNAEEDESAANEIVVLIQKGVKEAQPFFEWLAAEAVRTSSVNVTNRSEPLFERFTFSLSAYREKAKEAEDRKDERFVEERKWDGGGSTSVHMPVLQLRKESSWLALSAIEAFYSWTEHVFIHISILMGSVKTGNEVTELAEADWSTKFKRALDITDPETKNLFDKLVIIRKQLRNFVAHGSFGKEGRAFSFHSGAGAVPVLLPHKAGSGKFSIGSKLSFNDDETLAVIEEFIEHLWSGSREPAKAYIQDSDLPLILTMAEDGTYINAMSSVDDMAELINHLSGQFDRSADMDW